MDRNHVTDYAKWLRDQPRVARSLMCLMQTPGETVSHHALTFSAGHKGGNVSQSARSMADRLRRALFDKLGPGEWVETVYGQGYRVTGKTAKRILEEMGK